jgi:thioredoxin-like negative regulator of GroEL
MSILSGPGGGRTGGGPGERSGPGAGTAIPTVTEREFEREVLRSELPVLIVFVSDRSAACKQIAPEVDAFAEEMQGKVKVVKVDIDRAALLARELRVQSVPTFMVFAQQRIVDAQAGPLRKKQMVAMVEPFLPRAEGAIKPAELAELIRQGIVVAVDTRDAAAFARAHIPGATHMELDSLLGRLAELHMLPARPVLYCRAGDKTKEVAARLAEQGVPVAFLEGGLLAWEAEGRPIERG